MLAETLCRLDPSRPVLVEAESSKIGRLNVPPSVWDALKAAPRVEVTAGIAERTAYLVEAYDDILSDGAALMEKLNHLRRFRGHAVVDKWAALIAAGDKSGVTRALMEQHYDPAYATSRRAHPAPSETLAIERFDDTGLARAAEQVIAAMERVSPA